MVIKMGLKQTVNQMTSMSFITTNPSSTQEWVPLEPNNLIKHMDKEPLDLTKMQILRAF
jgi:hypothetical protein